MPIYANLYPPVSISQGDSAMAMNNENPQPSLSGLRINAQRLAAEVTFAAPPGAFSFQLQTADTDVDASYSPEGAPVIAQTSTNEDVVTGALLIRRPCTSD